MTCVETIAAIAVFALFAALFSRAAFPALEAMSRARDEYQLAKSIEFVDRSFRNECASPARNIAKWKRDVSIVDELESCEVSELYSGGKLCAMRAVCHIGGERIELVAECGK